MNDTRQVNSVFDDIEAKPQRRKDLLPKWIRFFCWFVIAGSAFLIITTFITLYMQYKYSSGVRAEEQTNLVKYIFLLTYALFTTKIIAAAGLLMETKWAVTLGIIDACIYLPGCILALYNKMVYEPDGSSKSLLIIAMLVQIALLIPYLVTIIRIRSKWRTALSKREMNKVLQPVN